jgi:molecular chaperone GrpE
MSTRFRRSRGGDSDDAKRGGQPSDGEGGGQPSGAGGAGGAAEPEAPAGATPEPGSTPEGSTLEDVARQRDQYLEMWQRANADYQNLRRRGASDLENAARRAKESLLQDLLLVLDYLQMALSSECQTDEGRNLLVGVRMTRDELLRVLEREGVRAVPEGGPFDPRVHQAVATLETDEMEPGQVVATVRRGYALGDHTLRHAQVQVTTAPGEGAAGQGSAAPTADAPDEESAE